jgi:hypothetical protein
MGESNHSTYFFMLLILLRLLVGELFADMGGMGVAGVEDD